jgi:VWFA-related protein
MRRGILMLALLLTPVALGGMEERLQTVGDRQPTFRASVDLVHFGVTVTDRRGNFLTDLNAADFEIIEEGQKQTLRLFARGDTTVGLLGAGDRDEGALRQELHIGLLLDTSGSMTEDLKLARSAAIKFLNMLPEADDMTLVDFDTEVRVAKYGQKDFPRLVERIRQRKADGWTALYDAVGVYLDGAHDDKGTEDPRSLHRRRRHAEPGHLLRGDDLR